MTARPRSAVFEAIRALVQQGSSVRGFPEGRAPADLADAVSLLMMRGPVLIVTGFCIPDTMTGETDGPPGAASLARALLDLGRPVLIVTDHFSIHVLRACLAALGVVEGSRPGGGRLSFAVVPFEGSDATCVGLIHSLRPGVVVAVERPGRASDGRFYSMRGQDLSAITPDTDSLFVESRRLAIPTIAVGDGGNELGMGAIRQLVVEGVPMGERICAATCADLVVAARVSNWGAYGIVTGLSLAADQPLLHAAAEEEAMLQAAAAAGAVDGFSRVAEPAVDGVCLEENMALVDELNGLYLSNSSLGLFR